MLVGHVGAVDAFDAKHNDLHERNVHVEHSIGLKQRTLLHRDGESVCVCAYTHSVVHIPLS